MAEEDIIQNSIFQIGQSQDERMPDELRTHFADVDERTSEELLLFTKKFAEFVAFYRDSVETSVGSWTAFFPYDENTVKTSLARQDATMSPHLALFLTFIELYKTPQQVINRITGRHLDFYYKDVLRLRRKAAMADKVHVLLELKKNAQPVSVSPENLFSAGKDDTKVELVYAPTRETVINRSKVDSLRSVFVDRRGHGTVRYAPVANSADGVGGELEGEEAKWHGFGQEALPEAEVGFALASPVLRMKEGVRKVAVTLTLKNVVSSKLNDASLEGAFEAFVTGEKTWLGPYQFSPSMGTDNVLRFDFTIPESDQAVIDYDAAIHGYSYAARAPVLQVLLRSSGRLGYADFQGVTLEKAAVSVDVSNVSSLALENDAGALDPTKAFAPFGPQPSTGSRFRVGYPEALAKKLSEVRIEVEWKEAPSHFSSHYSGYGISGVTNDYFTAASSFKDGGSWDHVSYGVPLFETSNASAKRTFTFSPGTASVSPGITQGKKVHALQTTGSPWALSAVSKWVMVKPLFLPFTQVTPEEREGYITFSLEKGFLHDTYRKKYVENVMVYSRAGGTLVILNEPYTPTIQSIAFSYKAHSDEVNIASQSLDEFSNDDVRFFHITYFGQMLEHAYQRAQFDFVSDKNVALLPAYEHEGELLIGLSNLNAGNGVSILFQVAEGSADPDLDQQDIDWFVLCDNYWKALERSEVVLDTTNRLLTSGIIQFVVPLEATASNTVLPAGRIWIKGAIAQNVTAVCQLIEVAANAVEAQFADKGNDPDHLLAALEKGKITKLKHGLSAVSKVKQPYASFGGSPMERDDAFHTRVSERLRHKNRCITGWDYERIILEAFPRVSQVKCIPHAKEGSWLAPGNVLIVVVPDLKNKASINPLQPKVDADTVSRMTTFVKERIGMQVNVKVKNPSYQAVQTDFKVRFKAGYEFNYYSESLKQALTGFLSPWAYETAKVPTFGGKVYKSVLLDFVEEVDYVDYVTEFKMYSYPSATPNTVDINEARPGTPDTILVSADTHIVKPVD